jgi:hypothetical protein
MAVRIERTAKPREHDKKYIWQSADSDHTRGSAARVICCDLLFVRAAAIDHQ